MTGTHQTVLSVVLGLWSVVGTQRKAFNPDLRLPGGGTQSI